MKKTDTNQIQHETLSHRYKPNHNQNPKSVKYYGERERERERAILVIDVEPLRTAFEERESDVETERASE